MEYFSLAHDSRLDELGPCIDFPESVLRGVDQAAATQTALVKQGVQMGYSCIIEHPVLLVSEEISQVLGQFIADTSAKTVLVLNPNNFSQDTYYLLQIPEVDCLSEKHAVVEKGVVRKLVICEEKVRDVPFFKIQGLARPSLVVRLDVAEALLRMSLYGLKVSRVLTEQMVYPEGQALV